MTNPPVPDYVPNWDPNTIWNNNGTNQYAYEQGAVFLAGYYMQGASNEPIHNYSDQYYNPWTLVSGSVNPNPAAPLAPTGVTSSFTSDHLIALTWDPAHVAGTGTVTSYDVFQNGVKIGTSTSNNFSVIGLSGSMPYQFSVDAVDATGVSPASSVATITTSAPVVSSGKVFSPYIDVGLDVDANVLSIARAMGHNDYTLAFLQNSVLASGTASVSGAVLTVSDPKSGLFVSGYDISGAGVTPGTQIVSQIDSTEANGALGRGGHYQLSTSQTVASTTISESTLGWAGTGTIANDGFAINASLPNIQQVVQTLTSQGGVVTISIGGSSGTDPAVAESNFAQPLVDAAVAGGMTRAQARATVYAPYATELQAQYQSVIDRYGVTHLDFDIEGGAVANQDSFVMRDMALHALEIANPSLKVSYTLPVLPTGLDNNGESVLAYAKADGLRLDSVNIMAMDYGANSELAGDANGGVMAQDAIAAATATHAQILAAGLTATVGITPMLGVNDDTGEIFTTANGHALEAFASATPWVSSLGYWSVARDNDDAGSPSLSDSGTPQARWEFSSIFSPIAITRASHDVNGDGFSDMLLQNGSTVVDWIMQNGAYKSGTVITSDAAGYTVVGTGDFNGDGTTDVLLQNGGTIVEWLMKNGAYQAGSVITTEAFGFNVVGTGDFNGDGYSDILLQKGGTIVEWLMKDGAYQSGSVITTAASGFSVVGTGDFNGDGTTDILLQNGGTVVEWLMKDGAYKSGSVVTTGASGFSVVGIGDFNGDGYSDILLQNGGTVVNWLMKDGAYQSGNVITTGATGFSVVGVGDYNGDGVADIALQSGGTVVAWTMHDGRYQSGAVITTGATDFKVV